MFSRSLAFAGLLLLMLFVTVLSFARPASAQATASILDVQQRLSIGLSPYREWNVGSNGAGTTAEWRVGLPMSYQLTSADDPAVKHPISLVGTVDYKLTSSPPDVSEDRWRFRLGLTFGLKMAGRPL